MRGASCINNWGELHKQRCGPLRHTAEVLNVAHILAGPTFLAEIRRQEKHAQFFKECFWKATNWNEIAGEIKVKWALVQALRLCTGRTAYRGSTGIALFFLDHATRRGERSASRPGRSLHPGKTRYPLYRRLGGPQDRSGQVRKISTHRDSNPGPSSP